MEKERVIAEFEKFKKEIERLFPDVNVALCELLGRRWSFVKGLSQDTVYPFIKRIQIGDRFGVSIFSESYDLEKVKRIEDILKGYFDEVK